MSATYSASIATAGSCELVVLRDNGDIVFGPVALGVPDVIARDAADEALDRDGWKRTSTWDSDLGEYYADVEFKKAERMARTERTDYTDRPERQD